VIAALVWSSGDRLTLTAEAGMMVTRRDPSGTVTLPRGLISFPLPIWRRRRGRWWTGQGDQPLA
jgi:hypothetical protein